MENQLVPALRFPEFKESWEITTLGKLMSFKNGVNATKEQYGSGYKFINVLDIINNKIITHEKIIGSVNISEKEFEKNIVESGDILFQRSSETREEVGQSNVYLDNNIPSTFGGFVIRGKKVNEYDSLYIHYLLKTTKARIEITSKSGGSTRYNVGQETLSNVIIVKSIKLPEQQKIANYLSSIDTKLNLLEEKKTELSRYKKAMMQKLFSQEIRFKDENGNDFPDWEERTFGEFFDVRSSKRVLQEDWKTFGIPFWRTREIVSLVTNSAFNSEIFISKELYIELENKYGVPTIGDLLVSGVGTLGICYLIKNDSQFYFKDGNVIWFRKIKNIDSRFIEYCFQDRFVLSQIMNNASVTTVGTYTIQNAKKTSFRYPPLPEQQKIANFLSAIDDNINKVEEQIKKTQAFKKAMLQQMFV